MPKDKDRAITVSGILEARKLNEFAFGGHCVTNGPLQTKKSIAECYEKVGNFILRQSKAKERGYVKLSESGIDLAWTSHIFEEPNESGGWGVTIRRAVEHTIDAHDGVQE